MSKRKQVLIICQTAAGQMYLGILLNRIWYSPILSRTVEEGLLLAQTIPFSLILFDGDASDLDPRSAITRLRNAPSVKDVPLVVFMTSENPLMGESLLSYGCTAVLTKPLDLAVVYGVLARLSGQPRTTPRASVKMRVGIGEGAPEKVLTSVNLSEGGLYLRTLSPLREGTVLHIKFMLPHDTVPIELTAEVVRSLQLGTQLEAEPGMGLRFVDIPQDVLLRIRNFVQWETMGDLEWKTDI
jgi:uncharacterized protein (TIGR02266 family)